LSIPRGIRTGIRWHRCQVRYGRRLAEGLPSQTVLNLHRVVHSAPKHVVRWNLISRNTCGLVDPPRVPRCVVQPLDAHEVRRVLEAAGTR
jgi:hypothetical protein